MKKTHSFVFYLLYFAALSNLVPYLVLYYQQLGFSGAQIGLLTGLTPLVTLVSATFWTNLADSTQRHRLIMSLTSLLVTGIVLILPLVSGLASVALLITLYSCAGAPIVSLADSATMSMLGEEKASYGRIRIGGTIGWGLMAPIAGLLIQHYGLKAGFWAYAVIMFLAFLVSQKFSFAHTKSAAQRGNIGELLRNPRWGYFLALAFVAGMGIAGINNYLFPYMQEMNAGEGLMGLSLTISTLAELPVMFFSALLLRRLNARGLLNLALLITGVRLVLYAVFNFPAGVLIFQVLNGMTFPAFWIAGVSYASENAPANLSATAQGLFGSMIFGFGAAAGGFLGGLLLPSLGGRGLYLVFGLFVLIASGLILGIEKLQKGRTVRSQEETTL